LDRAEQKLRDSCLDKFSESAVRRRDSGEGNSGWFLDIRRRVRRDTWRFQGGLGFSDQNSRLCIRRSFSCPRDLSIQVLRHLPALLPPSFTMSVITFESSQALPWHHLLRAVGSGHSTPFLIQPISIPQTLFSRTFPTRCSPQITSQTSPIHSTPYSSRRRGDGLPARLRCYMRPARPAPDRGIGCSNTRSSRLPGSRSRVGSLVPADRESGRGFGRSMCVGGS
jgi:hypothetical protein